MSLSQLTVSILSSKTLLARALRLVAEHPEVRTTFGIRRT
jgi:hypothetical protein